MRDGADRGHRMGEGGEEGGGRSRRERGRRMRSGVRRFGWEK